MGFLENETALMRLPCAYNPEEQAAGWYYYLENTLQFPFSAWYVEARPRTTGCDIRRQVRVIGLAELEDCEAEIDVLIDWEGDELPVPLRRLELVGRHRPIDG
jgi:hypothetical protein